MLVKSFNLLQSFKLTNVLPSVMLTNWLSSSSSVIFEWMYQNLIQTEFPHAIRSPLLKSMRVTVS